MIELDRAGVRRVELHAVEKELRAMWGSAAVSEDAEKSAPVIRACALNLVAYVSEKEKLNEVLDAIEQVSISTPHRAIVLVTDSQAPETELSSYIKSVCRVPDASGKKLCCEQIVVLGGPKASTLMHSAIYPLLMPDLPVYLWWNHRPEFEGPLFERFTLAVDRLIVDSDLFDRKDFDRLVDFVCRRRRELRASDLNWGRLTRWRQLLAQLYDSAHYRPYLSRVNRVSMKYASGPSFPVRSLLLLGWLASRLKWTPEGEILQVGSRHEARFKSATEDVVVAFTVAESASEDSAILEIGLSTADEANFLAKKITGTDLVETTVILPGGAGETRVGELPKISLTDMLRRELELLDHDRLYEEVLNMASRLA